jgi:hypothetical protein
VDVLGQSSSGFSRKRAEGLLGAVSVGCFLVLVGVIFAITPNLFNRILDFFGHFGMRVVPNTGISLPAPVSPGDHSIVYVAAAQFSLVWGLWEVVFLALRFVAHSPLDKKAEAASNIAFWLGASYLISTMLNNATTYSTWFLFWTEILMLSGVTLVIRAVILAIRKVTGP